MRDIDATRTAIRQRLEWDGVIGTVGVMRETSVVCVGEFGGIHDLGGSRRGRETGERERKEGGCDYQRTFFFFFSWQKIARRKKKTVWFEE